MRNKEEIQRQIDELQKELRIIKKEFWKAVLAFQALVRFSSMDDKIWKKLENLKNRKTELKKQLKQLKKQHKS